MLDFFFQNNNMKHWLIQVNNMVLNRSWTTSSNRCWLLRATRSLQTRLLNKTIKSNWVVLDDAAVRFLHLEYGFLQLILVYVLRVSYCCNLRTWLVTQDCLRDNNCMLEKFNLEASWENIPLTCFIFLRVNFIQVSVSTVSISISILLDSFPHCAVPDEKYLQWVPSRRMYFCRLCPFAVIRLGA